MPFTRARAACLYSAWHCRGLIFAGAEHESLLFPPSVRFPEHKEQLHPCVCVRVCVTLMQGTAVVWQVPRPTDDTAALPPHRQAVQ